MDKNLIETAQEQALKPVLFETPGIGQAIVTPPDWKLNVLNERLPTPRRKMGDTEFHDAESFVEFIKDEGSSTETRVYIDANYAVNKVNFIAVMNDHGNEPGWRDYRATFSPRQSLAWKKWNMSNGSKMTQQELANFLEQNAADINPNGDPSLPTNSAVLEFVTNLSETRKVKFTSAVNIQNGMVQLEFIEEGDNAQKGKLEAFRQFGLGIQVFENGDAYPLKAFLRYRIDRNGGDVVFWFDLQLPEKLIETATEELIKYVRANAGFKTFLGAPA